MARGAVPVQGRTQIQTGQRAGLPGHGKDTLNASAPRSTTTLTLLDVVVVSTVCFGLFILASLQAVLADFPAAEFDDTGNFATIIIEFVLGALALLYLHARRFDIASLYPQPEWRGALVGAGLYALAVAMGTLVTAPFQGGVVEFSYQGMSMTSTVLMAMVNGTFEEVFLLGVLGRGLQSRGISIAVGLPLLVRISYHLYQGPVGALWILTMGLVFALYYLRTGRLWPVVFAHILGDIVPVLFSQG